MSESRDSDLAGPADPTVVLASERADRDGTLVAQHLRHVSESPGAVVAKEWVPGDHVGAYRIEGLLGRGGMGVVYRAVHTGLDRPVALKRIHLSEGSSGWTREDALRRFHREAQTLASLDHPLLVKVYDVGEHEGEPYLAMEYVDGPSLEELLRTHALPLKENVRILRMAAEGIGHAHARGIVHRDLKPSNILVERSTGKARILDFGLAATGGGREAKLTRTGEIMGTVDYMAPEQVEATGGEARPPVDVYALGVVLYEALTGSTPFAGASPVDILSRRLTEDPLAPRWIAPAVPRDLEAICLKCLERSPARRYPEAGALAADLERWLAGQPVLAAPPSRLRRGGRWLKRHWKGATLLALVAASLVAVGTAFWSSRLAREQRDQERRAQVQSAATTLARNVEMRLAEGQAAAETLARIVEMFPDPGSHQEEIEDFIHRTLVAHPGAYGSCVAFEPEEFRTGDKHHMSYCHRDLADPERLEFSKLDYSIYDYFSMEWYSETERRVEVYWTRAYFDKDAGNVLMVTCSAPFYRDAGRLFELGVPEREELAARFRGVATVDVALGHIHAEMDALAVGKTGYCVLVERDGRILTFPEREGFPPFAEIELEKEFEEVYPGEDLAGVLAEAGESSSGAVRQARCPHLNKEAYFAVLALRGTGWRLVTVCPVDEVTGERVQIGPR